MTVETDAADVVNEDVPSPGSMDEATPIPNPSFPPSPILTLPKCHIRPYHPTDAAPIAHHANNHLISKWMTNIFPHPYTLSDGISWINLNLSLSPAQNFVIVDPTTSLAIGGIGLKPGTDVHERSVEVGYWLGEEYWGRGIATEALVGFVGWVLGRGSGRG
ncbi:hypothetical protein H2199_002105 [Coniosporium tulheliwenetii]|uniref:Uncharacterized protein n=1 Tax=Coniosporium tulheliwenetii TaxID=3383036 RepID=A0ACC2ZHV4_9PEZI|nr:hypothetical protein H2199_002105 [Cladosporium sp. JES 115]